MLIVAAVLLSTSSFAWFSMNRTVTANNMQITAKASSSLVIAQTLGTGVGTDVTTTFETAANVLVPATHDALMASGLKRVTNPGAVHTGTGLSNGTALEYTNATDTGSDKSYIDYVVYIASSGGELLTQDLTAVLTATSGGDTHGAASIDFYVSTDANLGTFAGTLNVAEKDPVTNDGTTVRESLVVLSNSTIPVNGQDTTYLKITMRCYFDGALLKSAGQAYVYSNTVTTSNLLLTVNFTAADHTP